MWYRETACTLCTTFQCIYNISSTKLYHGWILFWLQNIQCGWQGFNPVIKYPQPFYRAPHSQAYQTGIDVLILIEIFSSNSFPQWREKSGELLSTLSFSNTYFQSAMGVGFWLHRYYQYSSQAVKKLSLLRKQRQMKNRNHCKPFLQVMPYLSKCWVGKQCSQLAAAAAYRKH